LPVLMRETQDVCLHGMDFSVTRGQTVIAESEYGCSRISTRPHITAIINDSRLPHMIRTVNVL